MLNRGLNHVNRVSASGNITLRQMKIWRQMEGIEVYKYVWQGSWFLVWLEPIHPADRAGTGPLAIRATSDHQFNDQIRTNNVWFNFSVSRPPSPDSVPYPPGSLPPVCSGGPGGTGGAEIEPHIKNEIIEIFQFVRKSCFSKFQFLGIFGLCLRILEPFRLKYRFFFVFFNKNISNVRLLTSQWIFTLRG